MSKTSPFFSIMKMPLAIFAATDLIAFTRRRERLK